MLCKPIQMSYKQEEEFSTALGGTVTLIIVLGVVLGYAIPGIITILTNPQYDQSAICSYENIWNLDIDDKITLDTSKYNLALEIDEKSADGTDGTSLVRVQYYLATRVNGEESATMTWVNTTTCSSLYDNISKHNYDFFAQEFG